MNRQSINNKKNEGPPEDEKENNDIERNDSPFQEAIHDFEAVLDDNIDKKIQ